MKKHLVYLTSSLAGLALIACAHSSAPPAAPSAPKEVAIVNTLDTYPELTSEEVGRRFLGLIDSLKSFDDLTDERVRATMRLPMRETPETDGAFLTMSMSGNDWQYSFSYSIDPRRDFRNAKFEFSNRNERADMEPVCGLDFNAYVAALKNMGFEEDLPANYDEIGRLIDLNYLRKNVLVQIIPRREADTPEAKLRHACVESISIHAFGP